MPAKPGHKVAVDLSKGIRNAVAWLRPEHPSSIAVGVVNGLAAHGGQSCELCYEVSEHGCSVSAPAPIWEVTRDWPLPVTFADPVWLGGSASGLSCLPHTPGLARDGCLVVKVPCF